MYILPTQRRDVDDVHDMMDDITEQNEIAEEIGNALSAPIGFNQELDEVYNTHYVHVHVYVKYTMYNVHVHVHVGIYI